VGRVGLEPTTDGLWECPTATTVPSTSDLALAPAPTSLLELLQSTTFRVMSRVTSDGWARGYGAAPLPEDAPLTGSPVDAAPVRALMSPFFLRSALPHDPSAAAPQPYL